MIFVIAMFMFWICFHVVIVKSLGLRLTSRTLRFMKGDAVRMIKIFDGFNYTICGIKLYLKEFKIEVLLNSNNRCSQESKDFF